MDPSNFSISHTTMRDIMPNIPLCKYDVFNEIDHSWSQSIQKYGFYIWQRIHLDERELYFHFVKSMCDNKKMIIRNPLYLEYNQPEILSSDVYFITRYMDTPTQHGNQTPVYVVDLIANYYFEKENIVVGIFLGTGDVGLDITLSYIIYFNQSKILLFHHLNERYDIPAIPYYLPNIYNIIKNMNIESIRDETPLVRVMEGYTAGLFHGLCSFVTGVYIMDTVGIKNNIDELIIGQHDPYLLEKYYKNKYENINIIKGLRIEDWLTPKLYKGVLFKYGHFHATNNYATFIKSYINKVMPIDDIYQSEIMHIKNNFYPIFSINLRCVECQIENQDIVISEVINKLKEIYPKSFFLIGGFLGDYNEELLNNLNVRIGGLTLNNYSFFLNEYEKTFTSIKNKVNHEDIKSLLNLKINNVLEYVKNVNFSIHMNAGYASIESILYNIPSTYFGTCWNEHNRNLWYVSVENYTEPILIYPPNITFISGGKPIEEFTARISSNTIVDIAVNYLTTNNK